MVSSWSKTRPKAERVLPPLGEATAKTDKYLPATSRPFISLCKDPVAFAVMTSLFNPQVSPGRSVVSLTGLVTSLRKPFANFFKAPTGFDMREVTSSTTNSLGERIFTSLRIHRPKAANFAEPQPPLFESRRIWSWTGDQRRSQSVRGGRSEFRPGQTGNGGAEVHGSIAVKHESTSWSRRARSEKWTPESGSSSDGVLHLESRHSLPDLCIRWASPLSWPTGVIPYGCRYDLYKPYDLFDRQPSRQVSLAPSSILEPGYRSELAAGGFQPLQRYRPAFVGRSMNLNALDPGVTLNALYINPAQCNISGMRLLFLRPFRRRPKPLQLVPAIPAIALYPVLVHVLLDHGLERPS
ncbi:hypothetical protein D9619_009840 [Psilocybe cf. subviscida]|uniref:Uncharacterized protein n=1 Tax=Psilocybe cf. subviscida TaxID=2480587 RepID=A0A8H5BKW6_9AGAR|nr:hypothetical protein D9619_009840 [Psilocybe cf. subviscida]